MANLIFVILFVMTVVIGAIFGLVRGLNKSVIRMMTFVVAMVLTFVVAAPVTNAITDAIGLGDMLLSGLADSEVTQLLDTMPMLREAILAAPALVIGIVVFPVMFAVLKFVSWIVFLCIQKPLRKAIFKETFPVKGKKKVTEAEAQTEQTQEETPKQPSMGARVGKRFAGMGIGAVAGVLIFAMMLTPVLGLFSILPQAEAMDEMLDVMVSEEMLAPEYVDIIREAYSVTDSGLVNFYGAIGFQSLGKSYLGSVSRFEMDGQVTSLSAELDALLSAVQNVLKDGKLLNALMSEDPNAVFTLLADKQYMNVLLGDLLQSKMLSAAVPKLVSMATESIAAGMNVPANKEAVYNNMMGDVALAVKDAQIDYAGIAAYEKANGIRSGRDASGEMMTQEQYEAEVAKLVELTKTISKIMNKAISGDNSEFTDAVALHIVNEVRSSGGNLENFDATSVQSALTTVDSTTVDAGLLEKLQNPEKFETDVATVETIASAITETVKNALSDEEKAAETASTLANVVSDLAGAVSSAMDENGNLDATKLDYEKIGNAVSSLQNSELKGVGSSLLDIMSSSDLGSNQMVGNILDSIKTGYENGEDIGGTIGTAGALINLGTAMGGEGETDQETLVSSLTDLIKNLNEFTISLLPDILSDEVLTDMGVPAEYTKTTYNIFETLLKELMKLQSSNDYDAEVQTILSLYDLATTGTEEFTEEDIADLVSYAIGSDAIYNTLMSISESNPFGIEVPDEESCKEMANAIEELYQQGERTERERQVYMAVAKLMGIDAYVELN